MKHWEDTANFDFVKHRKLFFTIPIVLMIITIVATIVMGVNLDIKFTGGTIVDVPYVGTLDLNQAQNVAQQSLGEAVTVQTGENGDTTELVITLSEKKDLSIEQTSAMLDALKGAFPDNIQAQDSEVQINTVDPQVGSDFFKKTIVAVILAVIVLLVYIGVRFRRIGGLSAGVMAVLGLIHDAIMAFACLVLFRFSINDGFMAVILTILGYSVNNTIVIYDRIRENRTVYGKEKSIREVVNLSINQTLSRSINSTFTVVLALLVMLVIGLICHLDTIVQFVLPMLVGMIAGAYSSICVSGPLWVLWKERHPDKEKKKKKRTKVIEEAPKEIEVRTNFKINPKALADLSEDDDTDSQETLSQEYGATEEINLQQDEADNSGLFIIANEQTDSEEEK